MGKMLKSILIYLPAVWLMTLFSKTGYAAGYNIPVTRQEMLNVAKEIHPPGCLDSRTADYCQLSTAYETRQEIWILLESGMNKEQVIETLVNKYGDRILAAPAAEGFNLIPWILPGVILTLGAMLIAFLIRHWMKKKPAEMDHKQSEEKLPAELDDKVQSELENWL